MKLKRNRLLVSAGVVIVLVLAGLVLFPKIGFGQQDRTTLAQQTVQKYWTDLDHAKLRPAYSLLSTGVRSARPFDQYSRDMFGFLASTGGIKAVVGRAEVNGDNAVTPVKLYSPKTATPFRAYQHLFWDNGTWRISDQNGGLSPKK